VKPAVKPAAAKPALVRPTLARTPAERVEPKVARATADTDWEEF
jgi:hypothetical protein